MSEKMTIRKAEREAEKARLEEEREAQWVLDMAAWEAAREARRKDREAVKKAIKEAERAAREARKEEERARKMEIRDAEREARLLALPPPVHKELPEMTNDKYLATLNFNLRNDLRFAVGRHVRGYPAVVIEYWALRFALEHVDEFRSRLEARRW